MAQIHASHNDLQEKANQSKRKLETLWRDKKLKSQKRHDAMRPVLLLLGVVCILIFIFLLGKSEIARGVRLWFAEGLVEKTRWRLRNSWVSESESALGMIFGLVLDLIWPLVCLVVPILMPVLGWLIWGLMYLIPLLLAVLLLVGALKKNKPIGAMPELTSGEQRTLEAMAFEAGISLSDDGILEAGLEGERAALAKLESLDDDCHIYTNLRVPYDGGESETDIIVVTHGGVTIVEVKNYKGIISGDTSDKDLIHTKIRHNTYDEDITFYNPFRQVATHGYRLAGYLRERGVRSRVRTCVFFVNENLTLKLSDRDGILAAKCPVFKAQDLNQLLRYLQNSGTAFPERDYNKTLDILNGLMR